MAQRDEGALNGPLTDAQRAMQRVQGAVWALGVVGIVALVTLGSMFLVWAGASDTAVALVQLLTIGASIVAGIALTLRRRQRTSLARIADRLDRLWGIEGSVGARAVWEISRDTGRFGESPELADLALDRLRQRVALAEGPAQLQRAELSRLRPVAASVLALLLVTLGFVAVAPTTAGHAITAIAAIEDFGDALRRVPPAPRLGEFRITYRYPDYVRKRPRTLKSPGGRVRCLAGTEVTIETQAAEPLDSGVLVVGVGEDTEPVEQLPVRVNGREIAVRFVVSRAGWYRLRLTTQRGELQEERRGHSIELEPDEAPVVTLIEPTESPLEVNERDRVAMQYRARDDFGLGEARVRWRLLGTEREGTVDLPGAADGRTRLTASGELDLATLELQPGDRVSYFVEVDDLDSVNGPKSGASRTQELRIYSRDDHHRRTQAEQEAALTELVHILGDNLEQAFDPARWQSSLPAAKQRLERTANADQVLEKAEAASREDPLGRPQVAEAFAQARREMASHRRSCSRALRRLQNGRGAEPQRYAAAEQKMVGFLEKQSVYLADLLNDQRLLDAEALAQALREEQLALREALEAYRAAPDEAGRQRLAEAIEQIQERIARLAQEMSKLQNSVATEYVNRDALDARAPQASLDRMQQLLEEGKFDEAMQQVESMLAQTERMLSELRQGRQEIQSREYSEIAQRAEEIWSALEDLEMRQREIARRTEEMDGSLRERMSEKVDDSDAFVQRQVERLRRADRHVESVAPDEALPDGDTFESIRQRLADGVRALAAKDFGAAHEVLQRGSNQIEQLERSALRRLDQADRFGALFADLEGVRRTAKALRSAQNPVEQVLEDIEDMMPDPSSLLSSEEQAAMQALSEQEAQLAERARGLGQQLQELGEQVPMVGPEAGQKVSEALQAMQQAVDDLSQLDAPNGLNQERRALESLAQLKEQLAQMGQGGSSGGGVPLPFGGAEPQPGGTDEGEGRDVRTQERVLIPQPEQFEAPAEFREDILDAAKQGTVEQFRDSVRKYYEELVK